MHAGGLPPAAKCVSRFLLIAFSPEATLFCRRMNHFSFPFHFKALYEKAVALYAEGKRGADTFFTAEQKQFLAANGITPQHMYDYAEDHNGYEGEPGLLQAVGIEIVALVAVFILCTALSARVFRWE